MKDKLIPMSDFIEQQERTSTIDTSQIDWYDTEIMKLEQIRSYANFLKQPLTLGMFVPCDESGNFIDVNSRYPILNTDENDKLDASYAKAKERVLFEGFELGSLNTVINSELGLTIYIDTYQFFIEDTLGIGGGDLYGNTLEALAHADLQIKLSESGLKQIGLKKN